MTITDMLKTLPEFQPGTGIRMTQREHGSGTWLLEVVGIEYQFQQIVITGFVLEQHIRTNEIARSTQMPQAVSLRIFPTTEIEIL